jgi:hypothetical protein
MSSRRSIYALVAVLAAGGAVLVAPQAASAATPVAVGRYKSVPTAHVLDTRTGVGAAKARVASGGSVSFAVPATVPAGATSVLLNLTVTNTTGSGYVTAYAKGSNRPTVSNLNYVKGQTVGNLASVPLSSSGQVTVSNTGSTVDLLADLSGYVSPGAARTDAQRTPGTPLDALGGIASVGPTRVLDTRIRLGASTPAPVGGTVSVKVTGSAVPADASAVLVNLTAVSPGAAGYLTAYPAGAARPTASNLNFPAGRTVPGFAVVPIGDLGQITLYNGSARPLQLLADIQGYLAGGDPTTTGAVGALSPQRLLDTRTTSAVPANGTAPVQVTGRGGVPLTGVAGVVLTVTATAPEKSGQLAVSGDTAGHGVVSFVPGLTVANVVVVRPDASGQVTVGNLSSGRTQVLLDVTGYVAGADVTPPKTTVSRYVSDPDLLAGTGAGSEGCTDGASGASLVLLDIGTQSRTPRLGATNPGVSLVFNDPAVRLTYPELVTVLNSYVDEFVRCAGGRSARIALGTNSDGVYTGTNAYPAAERGVEWAKYVVNAVAKDAGSGITVLGANDIEAGFAGSDTDATTWTTNYLSHTGAGLIYNGSLDACSDSYSATFSCKPVKDNNGVTKTWTATTYLQLTHGLGAARISVLPQIYYSVPSQAAQWRNLFVAAGKKLTFEGSLTQFSAAGGVAGGYDGGQGWSALYHALATVVSNPVLPVATDLQKT